MREVVRHRSASEGARRRRGVRHRNTLADSTQGAPMTNSIHQPRDADNDGTMREDEPIPRASDDKVLEQTARLAREGRKELESDAKEPKPASE
jgi:hypothetical protein